MTQAQKNAANPEVSCFVSANAGTGKTRVLTYRVLRLLLTGVAPNAILCLTFTNAAAAEMKERVMKAVKEWAELEGAALSKSVEDVLGEEADAPTLALAKGLHRFLLLGKSQVNIQTIHGFCLAILNHFPVEAGLPHQVALMDERMQFQLMHRARENMLADKNLPKYVDDALDHVTQQLSPYETENLLKSLIYEREMLRRLSEHYGEGDAHFKALCTHYGIAAHEAEPEPWLEIFIDATSPSMLRDKAGAMHCGAAKDKDNAMKLEALAAQFEGHEQMNFAERRALISEYSLLFLKQDGEPRKTAVTKKLGETYPELLAWVQQEQERCMAHAEQMKICQTVQLSDAVYHLAERMAAGYQQLKREAGLMDFHDAITYTLALLNRAEMSQWVLFQLDQQLEHVLVDEAQDTSPEQWQVIHALVEDFFAGQSVEAPLEKSLFVVGDYKQSIYRFQGANPELFRYFGSYFNQRAEMAGKAFETITLERSFRTTPQVLGFVDHLFGSTHASQGVVLEDAMQHPPHRKEAGVVELWPLVEAEKPAPLPPWHVAPDYFSDEKAAQMLAKQIAAEIAEWLDKGRILEAENRAVRPSDIMILLRSRGPHYEAIHHALTQAGIPVAGQDRLSLLSHLFAQDMLALARFLVNPQDDYSLACMLKSPLYSVSEEALFTLCTQREEQSLYGMLQASDAAEYGEIADELAALLAQTDHVAPSILFQQLLIQREARQRYIGRMGGEITGLIAVFLEQITLYEAKEIPSMRSFARWLETLQLDIKQEAESLGNVVRIMTVHGSKGLEAPIVMLPDTCSTPNLRSESLMVHESALAGGEVLEFWKNKASATALLQEQRDLLEALEQEEYHRQLYVATTRARDELYMMGAPAANRKVGPICWYAYMKHAMESSEQAQEAEDGRLRIGGAPRYRAQGEAEAEYVPTIPEYLMQPALHEQPKWHRPSSNEESSVAHYHDGGAGAYVNHLNGCEDIAANELGSMVHMLLEHLPEIQASERAALGAALLQQQTLSGDQREAIVSHALTLLDAPSLSWLWNAQAMAELSVISKHAGLRYSGQVDRLVKHEGELWVVDFKTDRQPPRNAQGVPSGYVQQLNHYAAMLAPLYDMPIRCALLYTASVELIEVPMAAAKYAS